MVTLKLNNLSLQNLYNRVIMSYERIIIMKLIERICKNDQKSNDQEVLEYGYEMLKTSVLGLIGAIVIAIIMNEIFQGMAFLIAIMPLRQNAGISFKKQEDVCYHISTNIYLFIVCNKKYTNI